MRVSIRGAAALICAAVLAASCAGGGAAVNQGGGAAAGGIQFSSGVNYEGEKTYVRDWTSRLDGESPVPDWLGSAQKGNFSRYMAEFGVTDSVCRIAVGNGADQRAAQMRANMNFSRMVARDLAQKVSVKAAELARSGGMEDATAQAIEERTTVQSTVEISGGKMNTEFFRKLETVDPVTNAAKSSYVVYQIYVFPQDTWNALLVTYLRKVIGEMPANLKPEQREVAALLDQMEADERHPIELSQKQAEQRVDAEKRMVDAQIDLLPEQQKAAAEAELARLNQEALSERDRIDADARVAMTEAMAKGRVQEAAYLSRDPALQSAAVVTARDADVVNATAMDMAAQILF